LPLAFPNPHPDWNRLDHTTMLNGCTLYPAEVAGQYIREGYWRDETIGAVLETAARTWPDQIAVSDGDRKIRYTELDVLSDRLARRFLAEGFRPQDIVLLQVPNRWEFAVIFFALQKIGVLPVMCLPPHRHTEIAYFAHLTNAKAYFCAPEFRGFDYLAMAREVQSEVPSLRHLVSLGDGSQPGVCYLGPWLEESCDREAEVEKLSNYRPNPSDIALFLLSGGTTGIPKLIPRTHADYLHNARQCAAILEWDRSTVFLVVIPAAHNFPLASPGLLGAVGVGARVAMCPSTDPERVFEVIEREQGTCLAVSPALLIALLNSPHRNKYDLTSLCQVEAGGQKMQPELADRTWAAWPHATPVQVFGMAEGLVNMTRLNDPVDVIRETQGRPVSPGDEIRIVDDEGREVAPGEVGELLTRGPYTIRGYYKAEDHNRTAFTPEGFYRTGDVVRLHPSGNLVVEGRKKDMINRGGEKISAEEIENLILSHNAVHMVAVVAMPDPVMGERSCAFVIAKPGRNLTHSELCAFLLDKRIAKFKLPERLELVQSFPLTGVGKVSKKDLREQIAQKLKAEGKL
jgi:2,3-dihydroxybenzoate-AMP ligase